MYYEEEIKRVKKNKSVKLSMTYKEKNETYTLLETSKGQQQQRVKVNCRGSVIIIIHFVVNMVVYRFKMSTYIFYKLKQQTFALGVSILPFSKLLLFTCCFSLTLSLSSLGVV